MKSHALAKQSPFFYFWVGVLTGALIVGASFMIRSARDGSAYVLRSATQSVGSYAQSTQGVGTPGANNCINPPGMKTGANSAGSKNSINPPGMLKGINPPGM